MHINSEMGKTRDFWVEVHTQLRKLRKTNENLSQKSEWLLLWRVRVCD